MLGVKKMNSKIKKATLLGAFFLIITLCSFSIIQWNKAKEDSDALADFKDRMVFNTFTNLSKELYGIAESLEDYDDHFSETERVLYMKSIDKEIRSLNETGTQLGFLLNRSTDPLIYEQHIWFLEAFLTDIKTGKIADKNNIHVIGDIIKHQNDKLSSMIFEEHIGVKGINTVEAVVE